MAKPQWAQVWAQHRAYADAITARAKRITDARHERGFVIAASVGLPRHTGMIHNAYCDVSLTGWCKDNPARLQAATIARRYLNDWRASRTAERMISAHYRAHVQSAI